MREDGYYWVKETKESTWEIDFWDGKIWQELEDQKERSWKPFDEWKVIGPKIEEPEE